MAVRSGLPHPCEDRSCSLQHPQPIFIETEERKQLMETTSMELDIDLDEDGPLREEYMPKRRVSRAGSDRDARFAVASAPRPADDWNMERALPPPARWSPGADEPLSRGMKPEMNRHYAPQPTMAPPAPPMQSAFAPSYGSTASWAQNKIEPPVPKMQLPHIQTSSSSYSGLHGRSMSMSTAGGPYDVPAGHGRSASQSFYGSSTGYAYSDMRMTAKPSYQSQQDSYWSVASAQQQQPQQQRPAYEAAWSRLVQPASAIFHHQQAPWIRVGV